MRYDPSRRRPQQCALADHFFAGETGMGEIRRGVLAFDIAGKCSAGLNDHKREFDHAYV